MDRSDEAINYGLVLTAVEMGQAVTESGAISAVAAFFRQKLNACAWTENASAATAAAPTAVPPSTASATGAPPPPPPPLLRLSLSASGGAASAGYREGGVPAAPPRPPLDLVASRGPGPAFSLSETRVAEQAAALLRQAIARVRDRGSLAAAEAALENSLRGMQEASAAVAALVGERERRVEHQERQRADAAEEHGRALSTAAAKLARARAEAEGFRRRLVEAEEAVTVVAGAANALCRRAASERNGNVFWGGEGEGVGEGVGAAAAEIGELVAETEDAARKSLRCFFARVERAVHSKAAVPTAAHRGSDGDASPGARKSLREPLRAGERRGVEEDRARNLKLRVPVPHFGCDPVAAPLVLSLRRRSRESGFTKGDERLASVLTACLSTAISTLHEKRHSLMCARKMEADRMARAGHKETAAAAAAAASAEARERRDRAIAGTRALAAAAQASEARAESGAEATARAERQTEALRHLLSGLGAAGGDHAAVAEVVAERAAAAVPTCVSAVLLTPRQGSGRGGRYATVPPPPPRPSVDAGVGGGGGGGGGRSLMFSPDPRVWAAGASEKRRGRSGLGRNGDRGKMSRRWAEAIGRAASQAASTGNTVCVRDGAVDTALGPEAGAASQVFMACFSPLCASSPASACESESETSAFGAKENLRPAGSGVAVGTNAVPGQQVWPSRGADRSVCVIAWMLSLGSRELDADGDRRSNARSARSFDQTSTTAAAAAAADAATAAAAGAAEGMTMTTPPPTLPPCVSAAMEGVAHAVGLAVSSATAGDDFDMIGHSRSAGFGSANGRGGLVAASFAGGSITMDAFRSRAGGNGLPFGGRSEEDTSSRDEDLARLREGTSALSGRVQTLEKRAAGLRASEARSAAALARARADAMAVKGQLQLAGLERDRLLSRLQETEGRVVQGEGRRPLTAARSRANHCLDAVPPLRWREGGDRPASATMSAWGPSKERTVIVDAVATSARARPEGGSWAAHEVAVHGGVGTAGAAATASSAEGKAAAAATGYCGGGEATRPVDSPETAGADDASSQALQRMASLHARLSDSLRRGGVSARTDEEGEKERRA